MENNEGDYPKTSGVKAGKGLQEKGRKREQPAPEEENEIYGWLVSGYDYFSEQLGGISKMDGLQMVVIPCRRVRCDL